MTSVTRRYRFSASHRLHLSSLTAEQNEQLYGKCNNPYGHGHDYVLEVTCAGPVDPVTGLLVPYAELDRLVDLQVLSRFAWKNLNLDLSEFASRVPTTENIAEVVVDILQQHWEEAVGNRVRLVRIHIQETARNRFEVLVGARADIEESGSKETIHA